MQFSGDRHSGRSLWDRTWKDRRGHIVIWQTPNVWLIAWAVCTCISLFVSSHTMANVFWWLSSGVLAVWSLLEIFKGTDYFRRALGLFVLALTIGSLFGVGL